MKILIIKLGALGDVIISTAIINQILEHHKNSDIKLLTTSAFKDLFSGFEKLQIVAFERKGFLNTLKIISWVRSEGFDRLYDLQSNDRTSLITALSGIACRAGNHPRFPYNKHPDSIYAGQCHAFERLNKIIESVGIKKADPKPFLPVKDENQIKVTSWLKSNKLVDKPFVLIHAGSSMSHLKKRWPYYAELAKALSKNNFKVVWIGANEDIEINKKLSDETGINATSQFTIEELIELGKNASFAITNDSAPMHILSCSDIPIYSLFGPTNPRRTHALGQSDKVIFAGGDMPENDAAFIPVDISKISLEKVLKKLETDALIK